MCRIRCRESKKNIIIKSNTQKKSKAIKEIETREKVEIVETNGTKIKSVFFIAAYIIVYLLTLFSLSFIHLLNFIHILKMTGIMNLWLSNSNSNKKLVLLYIHTQTTNTLHDDDDQWCVHFIIIIIIMTWVVYEWFFSVSLFCTTKHTYCEFLISSFGRKASELFSFLFRFTTYNEYKDREKTLQFAVCIMVVVVVSTHKDIIDVKIVFFAFLVDYSEMAPCLACFFPRIFHSFIFCCSKIQMEIFFQI